MISGSRHAILGDLAALDEVVSTDFIDDIVLAEPCDTEYVNHLTGLARRLGVSLKILACLHPADPELRLLEYLGVHPVVQLYNRRPRGWRAGVKRLLDVVLSSLLLVVVAPVLVAIAAAIKFQGPGPIFYVSERIGRRGSPFLCFKFRSMLHDADRMKLQLVHNNERDGVLFKIKGDPRITKLGAVLRKYSLDELPQLLNVLRGEMSLVGPRPPLRSEVQQYAVRHSSGSMCARNYWPLAGQCSPRRLLRALHRPRHPVCQPLEPVNGFQNSGSHGRCCGSRNRVLSLASTEGGRPLWARTHTHTCLRRCRR